MKNQINRLNTRAFIAIPSVLIGMGMMMSGCDQKLQAQVDELSKKVSGMEAQIGQINNELGQLRQLPPIMAQFKQTLDQMSAAQPKASEHKKK